MSDVLSPKATGERLEAHVVQLVDGLRWVSDRTDEHVDAEVVDPVWPSDDVRLGGICVLEPGTRVEIKSTAARVANGQRGRFVVRRQQHAALLDEAGVYLLAVYEPSTYEPLVLAGVPATLVDERLSTWRGLDGRETYTQVTWSRVLNPAIVPREGGEQR